MPTPRRRAAPPRRYIASVVATNTPLNSRANTSLQCLPCLRVIELRRPRIACKQFERTARWFAFDMTVAAMQPAPFVNAEYMARHNGRVVRLVGTLVETAPGSVQLKSSDNAVVTVRLCAKGQAPGQLPWRVFDRVHVQVTCPPNGAPYGAAEVVEVMGMVSGPNALQEVSHVDYVQADNKPFSAFTSGCNVPSDTAQLRTTHV